MSQSCQATLALLFRLVLLTVLTAPHLAQPCAGHEDAFYQSAEFNKGDYGQYVQQSFVSTNATAPRLNFMKTFTGCDDGSFLFLAPRGEIANSSICILDASGSLVWTSRDYEGQAYNLQVQEFKGENYLTFWAGDNSVKGHGVGHHYMLDQHYNLRRTVNAANNLSADLHSFIITPSNTALLTVYELVAADLRNVRIKRPDSRPGRPARPPGRPPHTPSMELQNAYVWDSLFQEIDLETGELLFQWRASEHFGYEQSFDLLKSATKEESWDSFHINSVEKSPLDGNYLISSRHHRMIANIDGRTGAVLWRLGGKKNDFRDLSGGKATKYIGQHDAHWVPGTNYTELTLFDNRADWEFHTERRSYGSRIRLNLADMTAELVAQYTNERNVYSVSQGSYQTLPNGHVLLGYGNNGVMTEFDANGTVLCDAYFEPSKDWTSGNVQSYRDLKFNWTGIPTTKPDLAMQDGALYMSWLGSTEVRQWALQHSPQKEGRFMETAVVAKDGFETKIALKEVHVHRYVQVSALDGNGRLLSFSDVLDIGDSATVSTDEAWQDGSAARLQDLDDEAEAERLEDLEDDLQVLVGFSFIALILSLLICWTCLRSPSIRSWRATAVAKVAEYKGKRDDDLSSMPAENSWFPLRSLWSRENNRRSALYRPLGQDAEQDRGLGDRDYIP